MKINKRLGIKNLKIWDNIIESDFSVPYQFVEIFIPHLCLLISKITAHCQNDIVRSVMESLLVRELDKWFHLPHRKTRLRFYNFFCSGNLFFIQHDNNNQMNDPCDVLRIQVTFTLWLSGIVYRLLWRRCCCPGCRDHRSSARRRKERRNRNPEVANSCCKARPKIIPRPLLRSTQDLIHELFY